MADVALLSTSTQDTCAPRALGQHLIAEVWTADAAALDDADALRAGLEEAARRGEFTVLDLKVHRFEPQGVTAFALLSESHLSIHTWPEHGYAAVDLFTCGGNPWAALESLKASLDADRVEVRTLERGLLGSV